MLDAQDYKEIIGHFRELHKLISREKPTPIFIFEVEAKIRAYTRKLQKELDKQICLLERGKENGRV